MKINAEDDLEQLYWVDEEDRVLGAVNRKRVHDEELLHREIALLVYDEKKRVLFQKRSLKKRSNPGMWSTSVAGHVGYGREIEEEMRREASEEIGLIGVDYEYLGKELIEEKEDRYFKNWFMAEVKADYQFKLNSEEVDGVKFYNQTELKEAIDRGEKFNPVFAIRAKLFWLGKVKEGLR